MTAKGAISGKKARSFAERAKRKDYTDMIKTHVIPELKKSMRVVDFCTGSGNIIPLLKNKVKEFIAIDTSDEMINILNENFSKLKNVKIIKSDVSNIPLESSKYDVVIIKFSLHHIPKADAVFKEAYRILKKKGRFYVIDVVSTGSLLCKLKEPFMKLKKTIKQGTHELFCVYRTDEQIIDLISRNKFKLIKNKKLPTPKRNKCYPRHIYVVEK